MKSQIGALVLYCGHNAVFPADLICIEGAVVVRASGPVKLDKVERSPLAVAAATHHIVDSPNGGFWRPDLGVFVVPANQVTELKPSGLR